MKGYKILLLLIPIIFVSCIKVNPKKSIKRLMDKYPQIISITECWGFDDDDYNSSDLLFYSSVSLDIRMENNQRVFISNIRSSSLKTPFVIYLLEESTFEILNFSGDTINHNHYIGLPIDFISKKINIQLKSVVDVIDNYDLIFNFTNSLTKLVDIEYLLDIDQKHEIIRGLEYSLSLDIHWWREYVKPIIVDKDKWYILNITHNKIPNDYKYKAIENFNERELRYIYYRN
jgi:hypothetical protein